MQLDGPEQSIQFSISPRRRAATPRRTCRLAWTSGETSGRCAERHRPFEPLFGLCEFPFIHVKESERPRQGHRFHRLLKGRGRIELELLNFQSQVGDASTPYSPQRFTQLVERIVVVNCSHIGEGCAGNIAVKLALLGIDAELVPGAFGSGNVSLNDDKSSVAVAWIGGVVPGDLFKLSRPTNQATAPAAITKQQMPAASIRKATRSTRLAPLRSLSLC